MAIILADAGDRRAGYCRPTGRLRRPSSTGEGFAATAAGGAIALLTGSGDYHAGTIADGFGSAYTRASGSAGQLTQAADTGRVTLLASADLYLLVAGLALLLTALI